MVLPEHGLPARPLSAIAIVTARETVTVGEYLQRVDVIASAITSHAWRGAKPRLLIPSDDPVFALTAIMACSRAGAIAVPWRPQTQARDVLARVVRASGVLTAVPASKQCIVESIDTPDSETPWPGDLIVMTSGSTGEPKGVLLDSNGVALNAALAGWNIGLTDCTAWSIDIDIALMSALSHFLMAWHAQLPLYHLAGLDLHARAQLFREHRMGFGGAPLQLSQMMEQLPADVAPTVLVSSGDFLNGATLARLRGRFPETRIVKLYGLTELSGRFCVAPDAVLRERPDVAGRPMPGFRVAILPKDDEIANAEEPGEIAVDSPLLFHGYCRSEEGFTPRPAGLFRTGDLGARTEDGVITLFGRRGDVFKVAGEKVDRITIERALLPMFPNVELCVLPIPHPLIGHVPALFLGVTSTTALPDWTDVVAHMREQLPSRYIPGMMLIVDGGLPKLDNGKLHKQKLLAERTQYRSLL